MAKISALLDSIDLGHMALPEFQRGYVWTGDQVRAFFTSLYKRYPVGSLLVWQTQAGDAPHKGDQQLAGGPVQLLLDGQQRVTSLYGVMRGRAPQFFEGNNKAFTSLYFNLKDETFEFYQPLKMQGDPSWVDVTALLQGGPDGIEALPEETKKYTRALLRLLGISDISLHEEPVTQQSIEEVVEIFNRVNSGGTKLSKGDLALAKICAQWPEGRKRMRTHIEEWKRKGYIFNLDWLLRSVNTILTGEAQFHFLHDKSTEDVQGALQSATKHINSCLNAIDGRLGLDHDRVLFGRYAFPVMARYLHNRQGPLTAVERDKLLFWYVQSAMWGRFSGSTETIIDRDLESLTLAGDSLDNLITSLESWRGSLRITPDHFSGFERGSRFYPVLYLLTRMGGARDWGNDLPLKSNMLGNLSQLHLHHIFPKAQLRRNGISRRPEVNALANFCFLTAETNLYISDRLPEDYFPEIERDNPGALASQWIPMDPDLWKIERYYDFLAERRNLLAGEANRILDELLLGPERPEVDSSMTVVGAPSAPAVIMQQPGASAEELSEFEIAQALDEWVVQMGFPAGVIDYEIIDPRTGEQLAVLDLAWPYGLQEELSQPVVVLIDEEDDVLKLAARAGFRCFTDTEQFKSYVKDEVLRESPG